jgi:hypothetical protein
MSTSAIRSAVLAAMSASLSVAVAACAGSGATSAQPQATASTSSGGDTRNGSPEASPAPAEGASAASPAPGTTGSASPGSESPASATPPVPDAAMHVQSTAGASGWFAHIDIERRDDASLHFNGQEIGRMNAGRITTIDGQLVPLQGRLSIGVRGHREHLEMQPDGSVVMDMGRLTVDPSGEVQVTRGTNTRPAHVHITGYSPATAPLATILLTYGIMKADLSSR